MNESLRILQIEDSESDAALVVRLLEKVGYDVCSERVETEEAMRAALAQGRWDVVIADYRLPVFDAMKALRLLQQTSLDIPFLVVSGTIGEEIAVELMKAGAQDYLMKDNLSRLAPAVRREIQETRTRRDRELADKARLEAQTRYQALFEQSPDGIVIIDPLTARPLEFNEVAHRQLGYTREEFFRLSISDFEAAETAEQTRANIYRMLPQGRRDFETLHRTRAGELRNVHVTAQLLEISGRPVYHCVWRDITERKQAEAALKASEERYRRIFEAGNDAVFLASITPDGLVGRFIEVNGVACQRLGYSREELLQKTPRDIDPSITEEAIRERMKRITEKLGIVFQTTHLARDGRRIPVEISSHFVEWEGKPMVLSIARDLTERHTAEAALRESERRFRDMMENVRLVAIMLDGNRRILFANEFLLRLTGWTAEEVLGQDWFEWFIPPSEFDRVKPVFDALLQETAMPNFENEIRTRSGEHRLIAWNNTGLKNAAGQVVGVASIGEDITERKRLEAQFRQAQKMEGVGQLAGGLAHDFNNILAATLLQLELMQLNPKLDDRVQESVKDLISLAQRAANLTRQLLLFSRRSVMQVQPLHLNDVVENLLKMLRRLIGEHIELNWRAGPQLPPIEADAGMLEQLLMNLVVNARDAMPKGGQLSIATELVVLDAEQAKLHPQASPGSFICLSVVDSGCGMNDETLKRIFEPFFTTKEADKGTGLGLATVYGIVSQHRGWITVESQVAKGSVFRVFLPAASPASAAGSSAAASEPVRGGSEAILLVEDDPAVRKTISTFLRRWGYRVWEAGSGPEALKLWPTTEGQVDLLFTDMIMPQGMTGMELAEQLRHIKPELRVIISSGYSTELVDQAGALIDGVNYLAKPCSPNELAKAVRRCLDKPPA